MRRFISILALGALSAPAAAQIVPVDLPPSDVVVTEGDAEYGSDGMMSDEDDVYRDEGDRGDYADQAAGEEDRYDDYGDGDSRDDDAYSDGAADEYRALPSDERIADTMSAMMRALMQIRIGPIVEAARTIDPDMDMPNVDRNDTIGDVASRGDPDYEDRIEDGIRRNTAITGTVVTELVKMMPALLAMAKDLEEQAERRPGFRDPR